MLNLMIDLETLGIEDSSVIAQIGLVIFTDLGEVKTELDIKIDVTHSLLDGFTVDPNTVNGFWAKQETDTIQNVLFNGPRSAPRVVASALDSWLKHNFGAEPFKVWANGILFDIPKIDNFLTKYGYDSLSTRAGYNNICDFRTIKQVFQNIFPDSYDNITSKVKDGTPHNAISDCRWQKQVLINIINEMQRGYYD